MIPIDRGEGGYPPLYHKVNTIPKREPPSLNTIAGPHRVKSSIPTAAALHAAEPVSALLADSAFRSHRLARGSSLPLPASLAPTTAASQEPTQARPPNFQTLAALQDSTETSSLQEHGSLLSPSLRGRASRLHHTPVPCGDSRAIRDCASKTRPTNLNLPLASTRRTYALPQVA